MGTYDLRGALRRTLLGAAVTCMVIAAYVASATAEDLAPQLTEAIKAARSEFQPFTQADLDRRIAKVRQAAAALESRLAQDGENGKAWADYVQIHQLSEALRSPSPDAATLQSAYARFSASHEGLGLVWFRDVQHALRRYLDAAAGIKNPELRGQYEAMMDALAERLPAYVANPTGENAVVIGRAVRWLDDAGAAPEVVRLIHEKLDQPNLYVQVSADLIAAGMAEAIDDTSPVRDCILGTTIVGSGHTVGETLVDLPPSDDFGVIDTLFFARTNSQTVGYNGPVQIFTTGVTDLAARKRIWISADGWKSYPSVASARTNTRINSIRGRRSGGMVERIAWRRAGEQKGQAQQIASRHAEQKLNARIDTQAEQPLAEANAQFETKFRRPLGEHRLFPKSLHFSTTPAALQVVSLQSDVDQLGAPGAPPAAAATGDVVLRVHESMINNSAAIALAGMMIRDESFRHGVADWLGRMPAQLQDNEDQEPLAVTFAPDQPISVAFGEGRITVTVRGMRYHRDQESFPGMNVTAVYAIEPTAEGVKFVRQGELEIFPPGFAPGGEQRLSTRQVAIRTILARRFGKLFPPEIVPEGVALEGRWSKAGKLRAASATSGDGWLTVAWNRVAAPTAN